MKDENKTNINWFPGHMAQTRRKIKEFLKEVDLVAEILDARIPISSSNPEINEIIENKPKIIVLNKTDLSDEIQNKKWIDFYKNQGYSCVPFSFKNKKSVNLFVNEVMKVMSSKIKSWKDKGMINRSIRIMVVGIPNVGKSSFINKLCGNSKAKVENRPGVTRKNQWFSVNKSIQLLDTPGVLWPKFENKEVALNLAFTGAIKDEILDTEELAFEFIEKIKNYYLDTLCNRFKIESSEISDLSSYEILNYIGKKRGMLISGGETDTLRTSNMILDEFRNGVLGKITLDLTK